MENFKIRFRLLLNFFSHVFWWMVTLLLSPVLIPAIVILLIWKFCIVEPLAKLWNFNNTRRFDKFDVLFATDSYWEKPLMNNAVMYFLNGKLNVEEFQKRILEARGPVNNLIYQNLMSIPTNILGYYFWKRDKDFKIENHIIEIGKPITETDLKDLLPQWLESPFPIRKPLWDIRILTNYQPISQSDSPLTLVIPRLHHSTGDGYTFMKMMNRLAGVVTPAYVVPDTQKSILSQILLVLSIPSVLARMFWKNVLISNGDWFSEEKSSQKFFISWRFMPLDKLKALRRAAKVHFSSMGVGLLVGALNKYTRSKNSSKLSQYIDVVSILPQPGHPDDKMANHATFGRLSVPFEQKVDDVFSRILRTEDELMRVIHVGEPVVSWMCFPLVTLLPSWILRRLTKMNFGVGVGFSGALSTLDMEINICRCPVAAIVPLTAGQHCHAGIFGFIGNFNQDAILTIMAKADICPSPAEIDQICRYVEEDLENTFEASQKPEKRNQSRLNKTKVR